MAHFAQIHASVTYPDSTVSTGLHYYTPLVSPQGAWVEDTCTGLGSRNEKARTSPPAGHDGDLYPIVRALSWRLRLGDAC